MAGETSAVSVWSLWDRMVVLRVTSQLFPPCLLPPSSLSPLSPTFLQYLVGVADYTGIESIFVRPQMAGHDSKYIRAAFGTLQSKNLLVSWISTDKMHNLTYSN